MNLENNKYFKSYSYSLILGAFIVVGSLLAYFLIISPLYKKTGAAGVELVAKEQNYAHLKDKKSKLDELKSKESELKKQAEVVSNALPKNDEVGRMFIQLDGLAKSSNGSLKSVSKSATAATTGASTDLVTAGITKTVYSLPLSLPTYYDMKKFIANSDTALRLFSINDLSISSSPSGAITANITANAYTRN